MNNVRLIINVICLICFILFAGYILIYDLNNFDCDIAKAFKDISISVVSGFIIYFLTVTIEQIILKIENKDIIRNNCKQFKEKLAYLIFLLTKVKNIESKKDEIIRQEAKRNNENRNIWTETVSGFLPGKYGVKYIDPYTICIISMLYKELEELIVEIKMNANLYSNKVLENIFQLKDSKTWEMISIFCDALETLIKNDQLIKGGETYLDNVIKEQLDIYLFCQIEPNKPTFIEIVKKNLSMDL